MREIFKQSQYQALPVEEQIAVLLAVSEGIFDDIPLHKIEEAARAVRQKVTEQLPQVSDRIQGGEKLRDEDKNALLNVAQQAIAFLHPHQVTK